MKTGGKGNDYNEKCQIIRFNVIKITKRYILI